MFNIIRQYINKLKLCKVALISLLTLIGTYSLNANASCEVNSGWITNYTFSQFYYNNDAPVGTILSTAEGDVLFICNLTGLSSWTTNNTFLIYLSPDNVSHGKSTTVADVVNTNVPGIGLRFTNYNSHSASWSVLTQWELNDSSVNRGVSGKFLGQNHKFSNKFELVKTGDIDPSITEISIDPISMKHKAVLGDSFPNDVMRFTFSPVTASFRGCTILTPTKEVSLGNVAKSRFSGPNSAIFITDFTIDLNCTAGMPVTVTLDSSNLNPTISSTLQLSSTSTAKGINIILADSNMQAVNFSQPIYDQVVSESHISIPFKVGYIQNNDEPLQAGTANSSLMFTVSYP